jgi:hypothetical protein
MISFSEFQWMTYFIYAAYLTGLRHFQVCLNVSLSPRLELLLTQAHR